MKMSITKIERGSPETWTINWGFDITGYTTVIMVKNKRSDDDDTYYWKATIATPTLDGDSVPAIHLAVQSETDTNAVPKGIHWWQAKLFDSDNDTFLASTPTKIEYTDPLIKATDLTDL